MVMELDSFLRPETQRRVTILQLTLYLRTTIHVSGKGTRHKRDKRFRLRQKTSRSGSRRIDNRRSKTASYLYLPQQLLFWMWAEDTKNCQPLLIQDQHDCPKRKLKNCMPFWPGSGPRVSTRYPPKLAGFVVSAGAVGAVACGTNFCNILAGQF